MIYFRWVVMILAINLVMMLPAGQAAEPEEQVVKLETIVVTATKSEKNVEDVPGSISVQYLPGGIMISSGCNGSAIRILSKSCYLPLGMIL